MFQISLLALTLWGGALVGPYRVADAEPGHHQVSLRAAMAADGHFAVVWLDSLQLPDYSELNLYIRFFDKDGNPMTDAYKIPKPYDTTWVYYPSLDMDSSGNTVFVWTQGRTTSDTKLSNLRFMNFKPDGSPRDSAKTLYSNIPLEQQNCVSLANSDECAIVFLTRLAAGGGYWIQRFDLEGNPQNSAFLAHDTSGSGHFRHPRIALNDAGDVVVTWLDFNETARMYPRFQAFDAGDKPILPWEPEGYRIDDGADEVGACRPDPRWIASDRFVVFWTDYCYPPYLPVPFVGRVFSQKGAVKHPIRIVMQDSVWWNPDDPRGRTCTAVLADGRFASAHTRTYSYTDTINPNNWMTWEHAGGILGQVENDEPWRRTTLFEVSTPLGEDTLFTYWNYWHYFDSPPAVAACSDRIVWVYSRFNPDTVLEAWAVISDWDMGIGVKENPQITQPTDWQVTPSMGRQIFLRYWDRPEGFRASVFDVSGRKVDELGSSQTNGVIEWGESQNPGVFFIKPQGNHLKAKKVILVR